MPKMPPHLYPFRFDPLHLRLLIPPFHQLLRHAHRDLTLLGLLDRSPAYLIRSAFLL